MLEKYPGKLCVKTKSVQRQGDNLLFFCKLSPQKFGSYCLTEPGTVMSQWMFNWTYLCMQIQHALLFTDTDRQTRTLSVCLCLSLSLSPSHAHTHRHSLSFSLCLSHTYTRTRTYTPINDTFTGYIVSVISVSIKLNSSSRTKFCEHFKSFTSRII